MITASKDRIAIILVNFKGATDTIECVESLCEMNRPAGGIVVYVIENASPDDSFNRLRKAMASRGRQDSVRDLTWNIESSGSDDGIQMVLIPSRENRGFAAGCNLGLLCAHGERAITHFWLLNNDTIVDRDAAVELLATSHGHADQAICGSTLVYYDDHEIVQAAGGAQYVPWIGRSRHVFKGLRTSEVADLPEPRFDYIVGASMFFSRRVLDVLGLLPERYFLYAEEADWCRRAREKGLLLNWARNSLVVHKEGRSTGASARFKRLSDNTFYFVVRNNLLYLWQSSRLFVVPALAYALLEAVCLAIKGDRRKVEIAIRAIREFWRIRNEFECSLLLPGRRDNAAILADEQNR